MASTVGSPQRNCVAGAPQFRDPRSILRSVTGTSPYRLSALRFLLFLLPLLAHAEPINQLLGHPSPYLAMHGADPVHWRDWGPDALASARAGNKPLFISSGYFACHWCHVMQRESYRDPAVAALLNRYFIPVKVDRELHPALDAYLIDFVKGTRGRAGWPLNVFLTPEGYPLLGLTYASRDDFQRLLNRMAGAWASQADKLKAMAVAAQEHLALSPRRERQALPADRASLVQGFKEQALRVGDDIQGGFGRQTRFPMAPQLTALLEIQRQKPDRELAAFLRLTLDRMAGQGLRDLVVGGFFRYTVDPGWQVPHFEKMLYNQALHVPLYLKAAEVLETPAYRQVARDTLDFVLQHMGTPGGGYIASFSAVDGEGVEGGGYLWSARQLERLLDAGERRIAGLVWGMRAVPNNEGGYLPVWTIKPADAAAELEVPVAEVEAALQRMRAKLLLSRAARKHPRDTKLLAAWNGLMLSALAAGVSAYGDAYLAPARALRDLLMQRFLVGDRLHRSLGRSGAIGAAALEDYVFIARGLADWADATTEQADRETARRLVEVAWKRFYKAGWRLDDTSPLPGIPAEPALPDSPLPSPSAELIRLSLRLDATDTAPWHGQLREALEYAYPLALEQPFTYSGSVMVLTRMERPTSDPAPPIKQR